MKKIFINLLILIFSSFFTIFLCEITAKYFLKIPSFSELRLQFKVNNVPSFAPGFYRASDEYPMENKKDLNITFEKLSVPITSYIKTDSYGYRNPEGLYGKASTLIVGDSVVFGYGLSNDQILSRKLNEELTGGVYNLSVSGWGPASYMKVINNYISNNEIKNIIILYFDGNDATNLRNSCWPELKTCEAPKLGSIKRKDLYHNRIYGLPNIVLTSFLKNSSLIYAVYQFQAGNSIGIFSNKVKPTQISNDSKLKILNGYDSLKKGWCVTDKDKKNIAKIKELVTKDNYNKADDLSYNLAASLLKKECEPIVNGNSFGSGNERKMNYTFVSRYNMTLLNKEQTIKSLKSDFKCDYKCKTISKTEIFLNWLNDLKKSYNVNLFILPSEYHLYSLDKKSLNKICDYSQIQFNCFDLTKDIKEYYSYSNKSLYLDGGHLTVNGTNFILKKIINYAFPINTKK